MHHSGHRNNDVALAPQVSVGKARTESMFGSAVWNGSNWRSREGVRGAWVLRIRTTRVFIARAFRRLRFEVDGYRQDEIADRITAARP
jgi:hypothetical protein